MPIVNIKFIQYMEELLEKSKAEACVVETGEWFEPFNAFYSTSIINKVENSISSESKSLFSLVKTLDFELIGENKVKEFDENLNMFLNLNTKEDVDRYITLIERRSC